MIRLLGAALLVLLFAVPAIADPVEVPGDKEGSCWLYRLCDAEVANQTCGGAGTERFARSSKGTRFTLMADRSTSTDPWTIYCYFVTDGEEYHATRRTAINSIALTSSQYSVTWDFPTGDIHCVVAGYAADGAVSCELKVCP